MKKGRLSRSSFRCGKGIWRKKHANQFPGNQNDCGDVTERKSLIQRPSKRDSPFLRTHSATVNVSSLAGDRDSSRSATRGTLCDYSRKITNAFHCRRSRQPMGTCGNVPTGSQSHNGHTRCRTALHTRIGTRSSSAPMPPALTIATSSTHLRGKIFDSFAAFSQRISVGYETT